MPENNHIVNVRYHQNGFFMTRAVFQYNYGQMLDLSEFPNLPDTFEMHFANKGDPQSTTQIGTNGMVKIPDTYLTKAVTISCWLFLHDDVTDGETRYVVEIPVIPRAEITDQEPTPEEQGVITQLVAALNDGVTRAETAAENAEGYFDALNASFMTEGEMAVLLDHAFGDDHYPEDIENAYRASTSNNTKVKVYVNTGSLPDDTGIPMRSIWFVTDTENPEKIATSISGYLPAYMSTYGDKSCSLNGSTYRYHMADIASVSVVLRLKMLGGTRMDSELEDRLKDIIMSYNNESGIGTEYYIPPMRDSIMLAQDQNHFYSIYRLTASYNGSMATSRIAGKPGAIYRVSRDNITVTTV